MYQQTSYDIVDRAAADARPMMLRDREQYRPFYEVIERFAARVGLITSGPAALRLLSRDEGDVELTPDDNRYDFFSARGFMHARELTDELYNVDPTGLGRYTTLVTNVPQLHWIILVNTRRLCAITALPVYQGVGTSRLITTESRRALFSPTPLPTIGYELALLDLYRALCDPAQLGELGANLQTEAKLRLHWRAHLQASKQASKQARTHARLQAGLLQFIKGPARVIVGGVALAQFGAQFEEQTAALQIVSGNGLEAEAEAVHALAQAERVTVSAHIDNPLMPGNHRLRRLSLFAHTPAGRAHLADIYNLADFELVPFVAEPLNKNAAQAIGSTGSASGTVRFGTLFAIMRFALIDDWFERLHIAANSGESADRGRRDYAAAAQLYEQMLPAAETAASDASEAASDAAEAESDAALARIITDKHYIGHVEDSDLALKREASEAPRRAAATGLEQPRFFRPYMPAEETAKETSKTRVLAAAMVDTWNAYTDSYWGV
jgi:hypothetical protein